MPVSTLKTTSPKRVSHVGRSQQSLRVRVELRTFRKSRTCEGNNKQFHLIHLGISDHHLGLGLQYGCYRSASGCSFRDHLEQQDFNICSASQLFIVTTVSQGVHACAMLRHAQALTYSTRNARGLRVPNTDSTIARPTRHCVGPAEISKAQRFKLLPTSRLNHDNVHCRFCQREPPSHPPDLRRRQRPMRQSSHSRLWKMSPSK